MSETKTIRFADFLASRLTPLYHYAILLTRSGPQAENLVEEALIRTGLAWREAGLTDPESHARAVMARLAASAQPDSAAQPGGSVEPDATQPGSLQPGVVRPGGAEPGVAGEPAEAGLPESIAALPARLRTALVLRYVDGMSPTQISELLGGSEAAARTQVAQAIGRLGASEEDITAALAEPTGSKPATSGLGTFGPGTTASARPGPSPDLPDRIARGIALHRSHRRKRAFIVTVAIALVVLLAVSLSALRGDRPPTDAAGSATPGTPSPTATTSSAPRPTPVPSAPIAPAGLDQIIDRARAARFPVLQPDGLYLRAQALGTNGIVIGGTGLDYDPYRATDGRLWALGPQSDRRIALTQPSPGQPWAHAAGATVTAWAEDRGDRFELFCADPTAATPSARQVSRTGVATAQRPIHADGEIVVWADDTGAVQWVRGCAGSPRSLPIANLIGLAHPEVFHSDRGQVRAFNLESGQGTDVAGPLPDQAAFAANSAFVAWVNDGTLTVVDRRDGRVRTVPLPQLPDFARSAHGRLTISDRLVAYAVRQPETDREYGFVYDRVSGAQLATTTEAIVSRDRLLWREGTAYLVATVKPA